MRVISGKLKGRTIKFNIDGTRPTMDRVKESVFGSIQSYLPSSIVLDLFAGSGNLGIEAISNGSKLCYFVDNNIKAIKVIKDNIISLGITNETRVLNMDYNIAIKKFKDSGIKFDIIFVDPPYKMLIINDIILSIYDILNNKGLLILEFRDDKIELDYASYKIIKEKKYGDKFIYILKKEID